MFRGFSGRFSTVLCSAHFSLFGKEMFFSRGEGSTAQVTACQARCSHLHAPEGTIELGEGAGAATGQLASHLCPDTV